MANYYAADFHSKQTRLGVNGGAVVEAFEIKQVGVVSGDKLYFGVVDAGVVVTDAKLVFDDCGTGCTVSLGYEPYGNTDTVANLTGFLPATDVATAAGAVSTKAHPIEFANKVALVGVVAGANFTGTPKLTAVITGNGVGYK